MAASAAARWSGRDWGTRAVAGAAAVLLCSGLSDEGGVADDDAGAGSSFLLSGLPIFGGASAGGGEVSFFSAVAGGGEVVAGDLGAGAGSAEAGGSSVLFSSFTGAGGKGVLRVLSFPEDAFATTGAFKMLPRMACEGLPSDTGAGGVATVRFSSGLGRGAMKWAGSAGGSVSGVYSSAGMSTVFDAGDALAGTGEGSWTGTGAGGGSSTGGGRETGGDAGGGLMASSRSEAVHASEAGGEAAEAFFLEAEEAFFFLGASSVLVAGAVMVAPHLGQ